MITHLIYTGLHEYEQRKASTNGPDNRVHTEACIKQCQMSYKYIVNKLITYIEVFICRLRLVLCGVRERLFVAHNKDFGASVNSIKTWHTKCDNNYY